MKDLSRIILPEELFYTREHVWVRRDGDGWLAGITDYAQDQLGEVVYVDLPCAGARLSAGGEFGTVESVKSVNALYMPLDGTVTAVNAALEDLPSLVNADCYGQAWMIRFSADAEAVRGLLSADAYRSAINA